MAPIPSKTHTAGEAFGWQMPPRGHQEGKARWFPATSNLERPKSKLLERMYLYKCIYIYIYLFIYKYRCTEHLEGDCREDPPVLDVSLGMWNFLDILHVRFMFIEPSKWPADQDVGYLAIRGLHLSKISKVKVYTP